jgi:hypothetical protein
MRRRNAAVDESSGVAFLSFFDGFEGLWRSDGHSMAARRYENRRAIVTRLTGEAQEQAKQAWKAQNQKEVAQRRKQRKCLRSNVMEEND